MYFISQSQQNSAAFGGKNKKNTLQSPATCWKHHLRLHQASNRKDWDHEQTKTWKVEQWEFLIKKSRHRLESPVTWSESFVIFPHLILLLILGHLFCIPILGLQSSCRLASVHQAGYRAPNRKVPSKHCQSGLLDGCLSLSLKEWGMGCVENYLHATGRWRMGRLKKEGGNKFCSENQRSDIQKHIC